MVDIFLQSFYLVATYQPFASPLYITLRYVGLGSVSLSTSPNPYPTFSSGKSSSGMTEHKIFTNYWPQSNC